jgi:hypothetical protein
LEIYRKSMHDLLHPKERGIKQTLTDYDVIVDFGIRTWDGKTEKPLIGTGAVVMPKGSSAGLLNGFEHKQFIDDVFLAKRDPAKLEAAGKKEITPELQAIADDILKNPARFVDVLKEKSAFIQKNYETCTQIVENEGHRFGEDLPELDKKALTAFIATL